MSETAEKLLDLQPFCGPEGHYMSRDITKPFSIGAFTYVTNGHVIVRVPRRDDVPERDNVPAGVEKLMTDLPFAKFRAVSRSPLPVYQETERDCDDCRGRGSEHECPDCCCRCGFCAGTGKISGEPQTSLHLGDRLISLKYARLIMTLPDLTVRDPIGGGPIWFRFTGGVGAVMGLRKRYPVHLDIVL